MKKTMFSVLLLLIISLTAGAQVVSVLYFDNTARNSQYNWLRKGIADMLITDIASAGAIEVVEREQLEKLLDELEFALSDLADTQNSLELGKLAGAESLIYGSFIFLNDQLRIDCKITEVESGKITGSASVSGKPDSLFRLEKQLAFNLLTELGVTSRGEIIHDTENIEAARVYYEGLDLFDEGETEKALKLFEKASNIDPLYKKPRESLEEAFKFLADFRKMRYQREINKLITQAKSLRSRLEAPEFYSYADIVTNPEKYGYTREELPALLDKNPSLSWGSTRAQCAWNLQSVLMDIGGKSAGYFDDNETQDAMFREISSIASQARTVFADDPFLPEILYWELFSFQHFKQWEKLENACVHLMLNYPDYRMMWAIEGFYEQAIENKNKEAQ